MINNILQALLNIAIITASGVISYFITKQIYKLFPDVPNSTGALADALLNFAGITIVFVVITVILSAVILTILN